MAWIRLESERYPPPAPTAGDQPIIDAEYRVIHEPQERPRWRWRARRAEPQADPENGRGGDLKRRLDSGFASIFDAGAVLDDPGDPHHPALAGCLFGADDGRNARAPDDPDAPFIQFFYVASFVAFCAMWYKIIGGHFQPAGAF